MKHEDIETKVRYRLYAAVDLYMDERCDATFRDYQLWHEYDRTWISTSQTAFYGYISVLSYY